MEVNPNIRNKAWGNFLYQEYTLKDDTKLKIGASPDEFYIEKDGYKFIKYDGINLELNGFILNSDLLSHITDDYIVLRDSSSDVQIRMGARDSSYVVDKAITDTGFDGVENIDWINLQKAL